MNRTERLAAKPEAGCQLNVVKDAETLAAVSTLREVCESSIGPHGRSKLIHNNVGGHVTLTSSASRLFRAAQITNPVLRLVASAVEQHLASYGDGGTMLAALSLHLIETGLRMHLDDSPLVTDVLQLLVDKCTDYVNSDDCPVRVPLAFEQLSDLFGVLKGVISPKCAAGLSNDDVDHICMCLTRIFLDTLPRDAKGHYATAVVNNATQCYSRECLIRSVETKEETAKRPHSSRRPHSRSHRRPASKTRLEAELMNCSKTPSPFTTITVLGHPVSSSLIIDGTLIEASHLPVHKTPGHQVMLTSNPTTTVMVYCKQLHCGQHDEDMEEKSGLSVAVFSASLAGDCGSVIVGVDGYELANTVDVDTAVVNALLITARSLVSCGTDIVACQKVIHPKVKRFLCRSGIFVLDRLGRVMADQLAAAAGAQMIGSSLSAVTKQQLGHAESISHIIISQKSYICVRGQSPTYTLMLCAAAEQGAEELKLLCDAGFRALKQAADWPLALTGGGQWQRRLAEFIRDFVTEDVVEKWAEQMDCDKAHVDTAANCLADCLDRIAAVISSGRGSKHSRHAVTGDLGTGQQASDSDSAILDLLNPAIGCLRMSVHLAQMVLGIGHYVREDT